MRSNDPIKAIRVAIAGVLCLTCAVSVAHAQAETFTAAAAASSAGGAANAPVTIVIQRYNDAEKRKTVIETLKKSGMPATRALLAKEPDVGSVQVGDRRTAIKFVYARESLTGRQVTALTAQPIAIAGAGPVSAGFDFGLVLLDVDASGAGGGELVPATKIRVNEDGSFETEHHNGVLVHLSNVVAKGPNVR